MLWSVSVWLSLYSFSMFLSRQKQTGYHTCKHTHTHTHTHTEWHRSTTDILHISPINIIWLLSAIIRQKTGINFHLFVFFFCFRIQQHPRPHRGKTWHCRVPSVKQKLDVRLAVVTHECIFPTQKAVWCLSVAKRYPVTREVHPTWQQKPSNNQTSFNSSETVAMC